VAEAAFSETVVLEAPQLWWPHTLGDPYLYTCELRLVVGGAVSDLSSFRFGVRTTTTYLHHETQGRSFDVNGIPVFLQGGNWIAPDGLSLSTSPSRYADEVALHARAGLNFIRVWGGGVAERPEFYDAADENGILVLQEFWMTGDNNGRWGGQYDYPEDPDSFLDQSANVIKMIRHHPSLLFYGAGNELYPKGKSPRSEIAQGLQQIVHELDPDRLLILSSMDGGLEGAQIAEHDDEYALSPKDGPYEFLDPQRYFMENNPGLAEDLILSFQPEIGASSMPVYESIQRMGLADGDAPFPSEDETNIPPLWSFHSFQGYHTRRADGTTYNTVYAYGAPTNLAGYAARARLACHAQYKSLMEGFSSKMFSPARNGGKSAIVLWKTQSPWPSLRGFLYDWYLAPTGSLEGVQAATGGRGAFFHLQLDLGSMAVTAVHRNGAAGYEKTEVIANADLFDLYGRHLYHQDFNLGIVQPNSVVHSAGGLDWPANITSLCLLRLGIDVPNMQDNWYWLRRSNDRWDEDFSELGEWREGRVGPDVKVQAEVVMLRDYGVCDLILILSVVRGTAFNPYITVRDSAGGRILPLNFCATTGSPPIVMLEGEVAEVGLVVGRASRLMNEHMPHMHSVDIEFWAGETISVLVDNYLEVV